jgi:hypothetical protein
VPLGPEADDMPLRPVRVASKASWVDYVVARPDVQADRETIEAMSKIEIVERWGA